MPNDFLWFLAVLLACLPAASLAWLFARSSRAKTQRRSRAIIVGLIGAAVGLIAGALIATVVVGPRLMAGLETARSENIPAGHLAHAAEAKQISGTWCGKDEGFILSSHRLIWVEHGRSTAHAVNQFQTQANRTLMYLSATAEALGLPESVGYGFSVLGRDHIQLSHRLDPTSRQWLALSPKRPFRRCAQIKLAESVPVLHRSVSGKWLGVRTRIHCIDRPDDRNKTYRISYGGVVLNSDGTYVTFCEPRKVPAGPDGYWMVRSQALIWRSSGFELLGVRFGKMDVNPVLFLSRCDLILREMDGSVTEWRKDSQRCGGAPRETR
jgi:hypothetical protein